MLNVVIDANDHWAIYIYVQDGIDLKMFVACEFNIKIIVYIVQKRSVSEFSLLYNTHSPSGPNFTSY